ncbi:hypothetical protein ACPXCS_17505 [Streptomyces sp. DT190]|uniref:hypothetical protein n=1 Tax=unclassified Streptomyces TaxID=2593676 RepID=UPI003CE68ED3
MTHPPRLRPEGHADFAAAVDPALGTADVRDALAADPGGRTAAPLSADALARPGTLAAAAAEPYRVCPAPREAARGENPPGGGGGPLPALAVLTPSWRAPPPRPHVRLAARELARRDGRLAQLLLAGGVLRAARAPGTLAAAGWTPALVAALSGLAAPAAPLRTALRHDAVPPAPDRVERARRVRRRALLDHGVRPHPRHPLAPRPEAAITPRSPADTLTPCPARARKDRTPCSD